MEQETTENKIETDQELAERVGLPDQIRNIVGPCFALAQILELELKTNEDGNIDAFNTNLETKTSSELLPQSKQSVHRIRTLIQNNENTTLLSDKEVKVILTEVLKSCNNLNDHFTQYRKSVGSKKGSLFLTLQEDLKLVGDAIEKLETLQ